jgi:peptidoglycan pentaglycine glycine transferase (the first glycine)
MATAAGALQIKIDPDVPLGFGVPGAEQDRPVAVGPSVEADLRASGWRPSPESIQFRNTMILDIAPSNDEILAAMKQKTRYNVRLAGRRGVEVRRGGIDDLGLLYKMYAETSVRDGFVIRNPDYYHKVWGHFIRHDMAQPLIAEVAGDPVAAVIPFRFGKRAWYLYGMSAGQHREKMPNCSSGRRSIGPRITAAPATTCGAHRTSLTARIRCGVCTASSLVSTPKCCGRLVRGISHPPDGAMRPTIGCCHGF